MRKKLVALTLFVPDFYNPAKVWVVMRDGQRKYSVNQMINGKLFYKKFSKTSKYRVSELVFKTPQELNALFAA